MTVMGRRLETNGIFLSHEHILSRFGAPAEEYPSYDYDEALSEILPYMAYLRKLGVGTIACCTTQYFGRDARLLQKISKESGMQILANTGLYGAADDRYVPQWAHSSSVEEVASAWIDEWKHGIGGTGIKPGFVKVGVDGDGLSDIDAKLVRAAAITHRETGLGPGYSYQRQPGRSEGADQHPGRGKDISIGLDLGARP